MESIALRPQRCQWHEAGASFSRADASAEPSSLPRSSRGALRGSVPPGGISAGAVPWAADIVAKSGSETTSRARGRFAKFPGCEATVRSAPTTELPRHGHNSAGRSASSEQVERSKATPPAEFLLESFLPKRLRSSRPGTAEPATRERRSSNDSSRLLNPQRAFGSTSRDSNSPRRHSLDSPAWAGTGSAIRRSSSWASADGGRDVSGLAEHKPEALDAAVLILDIVGFSKLCARCTAEGTAGCENFALLVSDYLGRLVSVVEESGGDVEAFAGDALIVIFQDDRSADRSDPPLGLAAIVHKAMCCGRRVLTKHGSYTPSLNAPVTLTLHGAISAGRLWALEAEGKQSMRAEAFVLGDSISELSSALDQAGKAELVAAPTAWAHAKKYWQGRDLQSGCVLVKSRISRHSSVFSPSDASGLSDTFGVTCSTAGGEATGQRLLPSSGRDTRTVTRAPSSAPRDPAQYLPNVVTKKLQAGITGQLADHRSVSILFLVQQADKSELATINSLKRLQSLLGAVIDVVEVTWGGSTRQITYDDKGLTSIFVFGLSGSDSGDHPARAVLAAAEVMKLVQGSGMGTWTSGISTGFCFCGPIGSLQVRCEYVIMGEAVVTAARMAGQARKRGKAVLCAEPVKAALEQSTTNTRVKMSFVGNAVLKGNTEPTNMYVPEFSVEEDFHKLESQHSEDPSLEELSRHSGQTANLEEIVTSIKAILHGAEPMRRTVVIEAELGLGKRALLRQVLTQVERGGSKTGPMPKVIRTRCCSTDSRATYFGTCHQVMLLLCQCCTQGAASIPNLWYEGAGSEASYELPAVLLHFKPELDEISRLASMAKALRLRAFYLRAITDLLAKSESPVVIVVEDIHFVDSDSWSVLSDPGLVCCRFCNRLQPWQKGRQHGSYAIIFTSLPTMEEAYHAADYSLLCQHSCTLYGKLSRMTDSAILEVARSVLNENAASPELNKLITDYSQGNPLHAREIVRWLVEKEAVSLDSDGIYQLSVEDLEEMGLPPSLQSLIQAQLDHLPASLTLLLQCGSVMGAKFTASQLQKLLYSLSYAPTSSKQVLVQLRTLERLNFVHCVAVPHRMHGPEETVWEFRHRLQRQVVYDILLHKDRKKLHREAAVLYEDGACERPGQETSDDFYTYLKELVRHWVCAVQGTKISRRSSVELTRNDALARSDVKLAFNAIRKLLDLVFTHGKGNAEGMDENLATMLSLSRQMSTHDGGPFLELYSLRRLCSHYLAKICCSEAKGKDMQDVCQRCLELHRCAADLSRTLGIQLGDYVSSGKEQEASPGIGFLQLTDMAFSDVWVEVHRSGIPSAQHVKHMESMVFGCCFKELPGHSTYTQQYCALLCFYRGEFVTAGRWARSAYLAWTEGRSDVRNCLGASAGMLSVGLWHICDVMAGNTAGEAAFSLAQEIGAAGGSARALGFACATMAAALWESLDSSRVDALFGTAMAAKEAKGNAGPEDVLASCWLVGLGKLRAAGPAAAGNLTTWLEKVMALVDRAQNGGPLACLLPVAARRIVQEVAGMGSIGMPADGNVASKYRQHCKEGLKRCVETWERLLTAPEGQIFMGGSLSYCKAWLYWLECLDSPGKDPSQGLQGVIDALLEACRTSTSAVARESLAGTLPATIALCRILSNSRNERKPRKAPERLFKTLMRRSTWSMRTWKVTVPSHVFENPGTGTTWEVVLAKSSSMRVSLGSAVARSWARSALLAVVGQLECRPCSAKDAGSADWGMLAQHGSENSLLREARKLLDDIACAADRRNLAQ